MIGGFRSKPLERLWVKNDSRGIRQDHVAKVSPILAGLNRARRVTDMDQSTFGFQLPEGTNVRSLCSQDE
jgi:hypothetical protein